MTLAAADTSDGAIVYLHRHLMHSAEALAESAETVTGLDAVESRRPTAPFVVGCGVDIVPSSRNWTRHHTCGERTRRTRHGVAALASANPPSFASLTAPRRADAKDPGTGEVDLYAAAPQNPLTFPVTPS